MITKKQQLAYRKKSTKSKVDPESYLQSQVNDLLDNMQIKYIRVHDTFWTWLYYNCPIGIKKLFTDLFTGMPDNVMFIPVNDKFSLCLQIELKSEIGVENAAQKRWKNEIPVVLCRSIEEVQEVLKEYYSLHKEMKNEIGKI